MGTSAADGDGRRRGWSGRTGADHAAASAEAGAAASPWSLAGAEPSLDEALADPIIGLVLRRDRLSVEDVRSAVGAVAPCRRPGAGAAAADGGSGSDAAGLRGLRVLVAEDEALIALDLESALRGFGCEVPAVAASVDDALAALRATQPDVALLDLGLRDGRATKVAEALAAARVPFAVVSGYDGPRVGGEEPALRDAPFLAKPCGRADLRATLARLAASARSRRRWSRRAV